MLAPLCSVYVTKVAAEPAAYQGRSGESGENLPCFSIQTFLFSFLLHTTHFSCGKVDFSDENLFRDFYDPPAGKRLVFFLSLMSNEFLVSRTLVRGASFFHLKRHFHMRKNIRITFSGKTWRRLQLGAHQPGRRAEQDAQ